MVGILASGRSRPTVPLVSSGDGPGTGQAATKDLTHRSPAWGLVTSVTAWCVTCGTDVEFSAPAGMPPGDLAAEERACVWCGEALVVSSGSGPGRVPGSAAAA